MRVAGKRQFSGRLRQALLGVVVALALGGCGDGGGGEESGSSDGGPVIEDPGPVHVHGLGLNPSDGALFIATHTGLFRAGPEEDEATRVGDRYQDTMGFTVVGPDRFLGSGHPDGRDRLPPFLGLIRSRDAGRSWEPISLLGKRDFHALEAAGRRVYGYGSDFESHEQALLVSDDRGRSWEEQNAPEPFLSLAADPTDPERVAASGADGVYRSDDAAASWRRVHKLGGLVAWTEAPALVLVSDDGLVWSADADGSRWQPVGTLGGRPAALEASGKNLYAALHDGTIKRSVDGGHTWEVRSRPNPA
jgi:hypothetical protein